MPCLTNFSDNAALLGPRIAARFRGWFTPYCAMRLRSTGSWIRAVCRRIRAVAPAGPLLFASGYADVATFGDELAAETVLKKPYRIGEVAARIGDALSAESAQ